MNEDSDVITSAEEIVRRAYETRRIWLHIRSMWMMTAFILFGFTVAAAGFLLVVL